MAQGYFIPANRSRRLAGILLCMLAPAAQLAAQQTTPRPAQSRSQAANALLARRIAAIVDAGDAASGHWGIEVRDIKSNAVVYARNANQLFVPASTLKLVVSATSAHHLAADFRYRTGFYATGDVAAGVLRGDLVVRGRGDPTMSGRYYPSRTTTFELIADSLRARGINRIDGGIVADQTYFDNELTRGDWEAYDLNWWYAAPVAPIGFNDNAIDFRVAPGVPGRPADITWEPKTSDFVFVNRSRTVATGSAYTLDFDRVPGTDTIFSYGEIPAGAAVRTESFAVRNPGKYAATVLREVLESRGIDVANDTARVITPPSIAAHDGTLLFEIASPPLPSIIGPILQNSQNWFAEQLLKTVAREVTGDGSWDAGLSIERRFLIDVAGIDSMSFRLRDASGLSSGNLVTPHALTSLSRYIANTARMKAVSDALPVSAAETGSLRRRFEDLPGRVRAKTGSIGNVDSLSGVVRADSGRLLVFSVLVNNSGVPSARSRETIDRIVRAVAKTL